MENYYWTTEESISTNELTMCDYLDNHLDEEFEVTLQEGTYAEIKSEDGREYEVHASGNGNFMNHKVHFVEI